MAALMHVIGSHWDDAHLALRVHDEAGIHHIVPQGRFHWRIGERTCTGYWDGTWQPCPDRAPVGNEGQCLACFRGRGDPLRSQDRPACIFEPACKDRPEDCVCSFGGAAEPVPHVVYCAFYGPLPKVGMTMERRLHTRLVEQGADAYFVIRRVPDRQAARQLEKQVAFLYGLPEWRRHQEVLPQLTRPVDRERTEVAAARLMDELGRRYDVEAGLMHIPSPLEPVPSPPRRVGAEGEHQGMWLGAKGSHLFYQPVATPGRLDTGTSPVLALKRGDLMGRWVDVQDD